MRVIYKYKRFCIIFLFAIPSLLVFAQSGSVNCFMVLADPQLGMLADNASITADSLLLEKAIQMANEKKPHFLVVCGDLVNLKEDRKQIEAYKAITSKLDASIKLYNVAGNHDIGNIPGKKALKVYKANFGEDHYAFHEFGITFLVLNSGLFRIPVDSLRAARQQDKWLRKQLKTAKKSGTQVIIFQHHPWFIKDRDEADTYDNLPQKMRNIYFPLFHKSGVSHIFCGHHHCTKTLYDDGIEFIINGSSGKSLCKEPVGFRMVYVEGNKLRSEIIIL